jgi:hypothetical protein
MNIKKQITCVLFLSSLFQLCSAERVTFENNTGLPITVEYGKNKEKGRYSSNGKTEEPIAPSSSATLNIDLNGSDMFYVRSVPIVARGNLSKAKSVYTISPDGQRLKIS